MSPEEHQSYVREVNILVRSILKAQLSLAQIHDELKINDFRPFEQDTIYEDHYGSRPSGRQVHDFGGVRVVTRVLHQTGRRLSDIQGADLLYEIEGEKYLTVQLKKVDDTGHLAIDHKQLDKTISSCPLPCEGFPSMAWPSFGRIQGWCGSWYGVIDGRKRRYVQACRAQVLTGGKSTVSGSEFAKGLSRRAFQELFATCHIGAPIRTAALLDYVADRVDAGRILYMVLQLGLFPPVIGPE